jgi:pimeloyl-ACP methyl ester carboxylesterase
MTDRVILRLWHNQIQLAVHELRTGAGRPLLLLHGLGERAPDAAPAETSAWPGPIHALDFTGHGASTVPTGGGYSAELLMADVDVVLAELGPSTLLARGLGAYIAVLIAGARPQLVRGAVLDDGPGLHGGPTGPTSPVIHVAPPGPVGPPDPYALLELSSDVRTPDYAVAYARHAAERSGLDQPFAVVGTGRPAWLAGVVDSLLLAPTTIERALAGYAG